MEDKASQQKLYLMPSYVVEPNMAAAFNEHWGKNVKPYWLKKGVNHIGSFVNVAGGPLNESVRFFEFKNLDHWEKFDYEIHHSEEGAKVLNALGRFNIVVQRRFFRRIDEP